MNAEQPGLVQARTAVDRFVRARTSVDAEDLVQEALTRLLENSHRLDESTWPSYAVVVAGRLLHDRERASAVHARRGHLTPAPARPQDPLASLLSAEEHEAMRRAVEQLDASDEELLRRHYVERDEQYSRARGTTSKLARARAKLRVAYLLEHTAVRLPTQRCRPVLEALSTGDRRRQERTGAARHLQTCRTCSSYADVLVERRRHLAGVHPLAWIVAAGTTAWAWARERPVQASVTVAAVGGGLVLAAGAALPSAGTDPSTSAASRPALATATPTTTPAVGQVVVADGRPLFPLGAQPAVGGPVTARSVRVLQVPADEGFWVDARAGQRLWVQLTKGAESAVQVRAGGVISFRGDLRPVDAAVIRGSGLTDPAGRAELEAAQVYASVEPAALSLR